MANKSMLSVCVLGNKSDLYTRREVEHAEALHFAEEFNWTYYEVSAAAPDSVEYKFFTDFVKANLFKK